MNIDSFIVVVGGEVHDVLVSENRRKSMGHGIIYIISFIALMLSENLVFI